MISPIDVVVGQQYDVPCVTNETGRILPVMLPAHIDGKENCLTPLDLHYHIDFRFTEKFSRWNAWKYHLCSRPFIQRMKAIKQYCNSIDEFNESVFFFVNRWYREKGQLKAKDRICPHNGVRITNKCGTCPAHGLKFRNRRIGLRTSVLPTSG